MNTKKVTNRYNMSLSSSDLGLLQVALDTRLIQIDKMIKLFEGYEDGLSIYARERKDVEQMIDRVKKVLYFSEVEA